MFMFVCRLRNVQKVTKIEYSHNDQVEKYIR